MKQIISITFALGVLLVSTLALAAWVLLQADQRIQTLDNYTYLGVLSALVIFALASWMNIFNYRIEFRFDKEGILLLPIVGVSFVEKAFVFAWLFWHIEVAGKK